MALNEIDWKDESGSEDLKKLDENILVNNNSGIVKISGYTFWTHAEVVKLYVKKYLHEKFPDSLIVPEFNKIDFTIMNDKLPIEIQSTSVDSINLTIGHSHFEDAIRRQLEDNIENYNKCWFFFDGEYYRYLNDIKKGSKKGNVSLNLDWLAKYVKDGKLKVFTVKYNGEIKELKYEDLEFIRKLSSTCKVEYENDERILNRNKIKIMAKVLDGYKITQDEIDKFYDDFKKKENKKEFKKSLSEQYNNKVKLLSYISYAVSSLGGINEFLNMNKDFNNAAKNRGQYLGIVEIYGTSSGATTKFVDSFDVCQYFPGYLRHKEWWDLWKKEGLQKDAQGWREVFFVYHDKEQRKLDW